MTDEKLAFESVSIQRAPGFETGGFDVDDLSAGINIVHGPNAAGKTTLAESIQALLWPDTSPDQSTLVGQFSLDGDDWRVDVTAGNANYQQNGAETNGPNLPAATHSDRYGLSLHDLLQHETRNESFANQIQQESIGGYDLDAAHNALGFTNSPSTRNISEYQAAEKARKEWRNAKQELERLESKETRLASLKSDLEEASDAKSRVRLLEQAIEYAEARDDFKSAAAKLDEFPDELEDIDGSEIDRVEKLNERIESNREDTQTAEREKTNAEEALKEADLPEDGISKDVIGRLKDRRDELKKLEEERDRLDRELSGAKDRREEARDDIPIDVDNESLEALEPAAWADIAEFVQRAEELQSDREAHAATQNWLSNGENPEAELETLQDGRRALENWLSAPTSGSTTEGSLAFRIATVSALVLGIVGGLLGVLIHPGFFGLIAIAGGLFWYGYRASNQGEDSPDDRASARNTFARLSLAPPEEWTKTAVQSRLTELYNDIADAHLAEERANRREALSDKFDDLEERAAKLNEQREQLRETYGVAPETSDIELAAITKGILRWQDANDDVQEIYGKIERVDEQIKESCNRLDEELSPYGYDSVSDSPEATQHIRNLDGRREKHEQATKKLAQATQTIEDAQEKLEKLESERETIFTDLNLEIGDEDRLRELCDQVEAYQNAKTTVEKQRGIRDREAKALEDYPNFEPSLKEQPMPVLKEEKQEAEQTAAEYDSIQQEITEIQTKIDEAKRASKLEEAVAEKRRALEALEDRFEADAEAMVGDVLIDHVREETEETNRPEVFQKARELLSRITMGRYRLDLDKDTFRAYDTVKERGFALDELSSATRLQVLLAVRIAFVEQQEQGVKLPLMLDETLANTDDQRADAIIDAVIELARTGRQVFYFTAQSDEVAKWQQALADARGLDHTTVDLGDAVGQADYTDLPEYGELVPTESSFPDPDKYDHAEYGEALGVPGFSPRNGAGSAHVWYVVEDTDLLHHLLELGIERWGQLKELLEGTDGILITGDESVRETIRRNGAAIEEFVKSWEIGRGERVDRQALEETSAVTDAFIDEVSELARDLDGDAEAIIEALRNGRVDRFRRNKMDELEEYFEANGYIQDRDTLAPETIRARVVNRLTKTGLSEDEARTRAFSVFRRLQANRPIPMA